MTDDQARILSAEMDAIQQELVELRARDRARMSREFWMATRQAVLMLLDALERELDISPRTAELRQTRRHEPKYTKTAARD